MSVTQADKLKLVLGKEIVQLRADLASARQEVVNEQASHGRTHKMLHERLAMVTAESNSVQTHLRLACLELDGSEAELGAECAAHAETKAALEAQTQATHEVSKAYSQECADYRGRLRNVTESNDVMRKQLEQARAAYQTECKATDILQRELAKSEARVKAALTYLTDKDDIESTPLHAIGHAVQELKGG